MKTAALFLLFLLAFSQAKGQRNPAFVTSDIDHFWQAYDNITATNDSAQQYHYLETLFLQPGTPGLKAIMEARSYTARSYIDAINRYPLFWQSVRKNTGRARVFARKAEREISKLRRLYPELKPATTYFTVGALRTGGTSVGNMVLMGSEIALANHTTNTSEFGPELVNLQEHLRSKTAASVPFTVVHEYVHTQQTTTIGNSLLAQCVLEGAAEFVAVTASGQRSTLPALAYGAAHAAAVRARFASHMYNTFTGFWLYSNEKNEFDTRDLGYYVGYAMCENYYRRATDKRQAIKAMIELDYNDAAALDAFVEQSGYFPQPIAQLKNEFQAGRPTVLRFARTASADQPTKPARTTITLFFSAPMNPQHRNFELGPLGLDKLMRVQKFIGFSPDYTSASFEVELQPNRQYQLLVGEGFRSQDGRSLQPFLIDFTTGGN